MANQHTAKRVSGLLWEQELENEVLELAEEFADVFRFWQASIPTAVEAPESVLRPDGHFDQDSARMQKSALDLEGLP